MSEPATKTSVGADAVALLPSQFAGSSRLQQLIMALVSPLTQAGRAYGSAVFGDDAYGGNIEQPLGGQQSLEDALRWTLDNRWLSVATGSMLDLVGGIVGRPRNAAADETYRSNIRLQIAYNTSQSEPERLCALAQAVTGASRVLFIRKGCGCAHLYCHEMAAALMLEDSPGLMDVIRGVEHAAQAGGRVVVSGCFGNAPFMWGPDRDETGAICGPPPINGSDEGWYGWSEVGEFPPAGGSFVEAYAP